MKINTFTTSILTTREGRLSPPGKKFAVEEVGLKGVVGKMWESSVKIKMEKGSSCLNEITE